MIKSAFILPLFAISLLFVVSTIQSVHAQLSLSSCLASRLDFVPCRFHRRAKRPGPNQFGAYSTRFYSGVRPVCRVRKRHEVVGDISTLGEPSLRVFSSPGFESDPQELYANSLLVEYNLECAPGDALYFNLTSLDLEPANCLMGNSLNQVCRDYVEMNLGTYGVTESCGYGITGNSFLLPFNKVKLRFRTSSRGRYPGFRGFAVCISPEIQAPAGCKPPTPRPTIPPTTRVPVSLPVILTSGPPHEDIPPHFESEDGQLRDIFRRSNDILLPEDYESNQIHLPPPDYGDVLATPFDAADWLEPTAVPSHKLSSLDRLQLTPQLTAEEESTVSGLVSSLAQLETRHSLAAKLHPNGQPSTLNLDRAATKAAIINSNACNRLVQAASRGLMKAAERANPREVLDLRTELEQDLQLAK